MLFRDMIVFGMRVLVMEVESKARSFAGAADFERKFGAGSVLVEERVDRLQQNRFPAGSHLRQLRVQPKHAVKIKGISIQAVLPGHVRVRSRDQKMQA